jgi:hypothetical protein
MGVQMTWGWVASTQGPLLCSQGSFQLASLPGALLWTNNSAWARERGLLGSGVCKRERLMGQAAHETRP